MRKGRFGEEQIIAILREQEAGARTEEVFCRHGIFCKVEGSGMAGWRYLRPAG